MNFTQLAPKALLLVLVLISNSSLTFATPNNYPEINDELGRLLIRGMGGLMNETSPENSDYPTFTDAEYRARFLEMSGAIQYRLTPEIRNHIIYRTERHRSSTERTLGLTEMYFPIFEEHLAEQGVPHHIKYLPIVESNLNGVARSHAAAVGLWQFIPETARFYGLTVSAHLDERSDTHKASKAAATMLAKLFKRYGDWPLALAAYNCGPGRVDRYVKGTNKDFWDIRASLPKETQMYVPYFMAVAYSYEYHYLHELKPRKQHPDLVLTDSIHLAPGYKTFNQLSKYYNIDRDTLKRLNPGYIKNYVPSSGNNHILVLPARIVAKFRNYEAAYNKVMNMSTDNPIKCIRRVNSEYELKKLMRAHHFSRNDVLFWNDLPSNYTFKRGDMIAIRKYHVPKDAWATKEAAPPTIKSISIASLKVVGLDDQQKRALTTPVYTTIKKHKKPVSKVTTVAVAVANKKEQLKKSNLYQLPNRTKAVVAQSAQKTTTIDKVSQQRTRNRRLRTLTPVSRAEAPKIVSAQKITPAVHENATTSSQQQYLILGLVKEQSTSLYKKEQAAKKATVANTITKEEKQALVYLERQSKKISTRAAELAAAKKAEADKQVAELAAAKKAEADKQVAELAAAKKAEITKKVVAEPQKVVPLNKSKYEYYTVQKNETIWTVQRRYPRVTSRDILLLNNLTTRSILREGMQLKIPVQ